MDCPLSCTQTRIRLEKALRWTLLNAEMKALTKTAALTQRTRTQNNELQPQSAPWWPNLLLISQVRRFTSTGSMFTHTSIYLYFYIFFLWTWIPVAVLHTDVPARPLGYSVHAGPAFAHSQHQSGAEGLLFILYLLIITRLPSADHQSFIPHILTCASRVFVALAAALRNFCLIPSRLSLASHVLFAQMSFMSFTLYLTNYSNNPLTAFCEQSVASPVCCLMAVKSGVQRVAPTPQSSPGSFSFPTQRCVMLTSCH